MSKIETLDYINKIGIRKTLCATNMGNVIHILNNGQKYKEFGSEYQDLEDKINQELFGNLEKQTEEYGDDLISFPEIIVSTDKTLYGIVGDFEIGNPFLKIDKYYRLDKLIYAIEFMEDQILRLSKKGWNLEDIHEENILLGTIYESKPIRVIDTDYYCLEPYRSFVELYRTNIKRIFIAIIESLLPELNISSIWLEPILQEQYMLAANGIIRTSEFIRYLLREIRVRNLKDESVLTLRKRINQV